MKKANILIVDDIFSNQLLLSAMIDNLGHECSMVSNGKKAIEKLKEDDFDIVFMDIEMPVMNGIETAKYIRENFSEPQKSIPIIALTAHNTHEFSEFTEDAGFNEIVSKPYTAEKFKMLMDKHFKN